MLLSLQLLQQPSSGLGIVARNISKYEHMVVLPNDGVPIVDYPTIIVLRPEKLVVGECKLILCASDWIRVSLIPKVDVRYVEIVGLCHVPCFLYRYLHRIWHKPSLNFQSNQYSSGFSFMSFSMASFSGIGVSVYDCETHSTPFHRYLYSMDTSFSLKKSSEEGNRRISSS